MITVEYVLPSGVVSDWSDASSDASPRHSMWVPIVPFTSAIPRVWRTRSPMSAGVAIGHPSRRWFVMTASVV